MIEVGKITLNGKKFSRLKVSLPQAPLLAVFGGKGYVMCGYLNLETAEKLGQAAAIVSGVKDFDDVLNGKVSAATSHARKLGIAEGMSGREAIQRTA